MNNGLLKGCLAVTLLTMAGAAGADDKFGLGVKAGTLGLGVEGTWRPLPYLDFRIGANTFDYDETGTQAGIEDEGLTRSSSWFVYNF